MAGSDSLALVVKNTFLEVVDREEQRTPVCRSQSEKSLRFSAFWESATVSSSVENSPKAALSTSSRSSFTGASTELEPGYWATDSLDGSPKDTMEDNEINGFHWLSTEGTDDAADDAADDAEEEFLTSAHAMGKCKPCFALMSPAGCLSGKDCRFCHEPSHDAKLRCRPSKSVRQSCKRAIKMLETGDPKAEKVVKDMLERHRHYMSTMLGLAPRRLRNLYSASRVPRPGSKPFTATQAEVSLDHAAFCQYPPQGTTLEQHYVGQCQID